MSTFCSVMLHVNSLEELEDPASHVARELAALDLRPVTQHAGGNKAMQADYYAAAYNAPLWESPDPDGETLFGPAAILARLARIQWEFPEDVVLLLSDEGDARPAVYAIDPSFGPMPPHHFHLLLPASPG